VSIKKDILFRIAIVYFLVGILGIAIIGKAVYTQVSEGAELKKMMAKNSLKDITIEPNRGDILATDGRILATSVPSFEIRMDTRATGLTDAIFNSKIDSLARSLAKLPGGKSPTEYKRDIVNARKRGNRYYLIGRKVDYNELKVIKKYPIFNLGPNTGGLVPVQENVRKRPHQGLAERTIGYLTKEPNGNFPGLEGAYDVYLRGEKGVGVMQKLPGGALMPVNGINSSEPKDGGDVVSTIDVNIQDVAETSLRKRLIHHNAHHGTAVVMEVATGEIKAIVNLGKGRGGGYHETYNYALGESIEPGSTFKLMSYMVALEDGYIQPTDSVNNGAGSATFYGKKVHDDQRRATLGWLTVEEAFAHSSNVSITKIIDKHYRGKEKQFINRLYAMNLNQKLGLELGGEGEPDIKYPGSTGSRYWSGLSLTQMAYGYEVRLAPIHTLTFYNAVANDGKMVKPLFVRELRQHGFLEQRKDVEVIKSSISSSSTINKVKKMMEATVEYGTAKHIKSDLYSIAGKTGTAQIANEKFGYRDRKNYASFVGYFPADKPKYSCIVAIYDPVVNGRGGGTVAAPVFREIADKIYAADPDMRDALKPEKRGVMVDMPYSKSGYFADLNYVFRELKIPFPKTSLENGWVTVSTKETQVEIKKQDVEEDKVPNVVDMGLKDALFLLEKRGLQVSVRGRGKVMSQSVAPGSEVVRGRTVVLEMSQ
jgi:cell division protein FtsI (penicillin-binding protein 3)